jgi:hypothetical protein
LKEKEILNRILTAVEKQVPDMWNDLKNVLQKEKSNDNNANVVCDKTYILNRKKLNIRKLLVEAAACIIIVTTLAFTPAFAYIQSGIGKLIDKGYHDKGVNIAMENGFGQLIDQSATNNGITVTIDGIISDQNRTAVLLSLYSEVNDLKDSTIGKIDITDENGKVISNGGIMRHSYDSQNNCRKIVYSINSLNGFIGHNINVKINGINIVFQYINGNTVTENMKGNWSFNFGLDKNSADNVTSDIKINKDFVFDNTAYNVKNVVFSPSETRVYIKTGYDSSVLETKDMSINTNNEIIKCYQYFKDQDGSQVYCFDPIIGEENVLLKIDEIITISLIE